MVKVKVSWESEENEGDIVHKLYLFYFLFTYKSPYISAML